MLHTGIHKAKANYVERNERGLMELGAAQAGTLRETP